MKKTKLVKFIGFYDYTVFLTYLSLISSVFGLTLAINAAQYKMAIFCLAFSGICDAFDGRVARTKKDRTEDQKNYGIQLDSLCDVICFGAFPALLCYLLGVRGWLGLLIVFFYCTCAVIRLAFFNVLEAKRQKEEGGGNKTYRGLPVTSISFILPLVFWLQFLMSDLAFKVLLHVVLALVGFLFIYDFKLRKPSLKTLLILIGAVCVTVGVIFAYTTFKAPPAEDTTGIIDEFMSEPTETTELLEPVGSETE